MKKSYLLLFLLSSFIGFSQVPAGYYDTATGTGYTLKTQLHNIIDGHTDLDYGGLWITYQTSDRDIFTGLGYENDNTIYDMYTENPTGSTGECNFVYGTSQDTGSGGGSECQVYNREHIIPQSVFAQVSPLRNDAHFIPPTDKKVNAMRADYPHGNVAVASWTSNNGGKLGTSAVPGYTGTVFEPNSAFKGDIARMYLYFATRYEDTVAGYTYEMFNGTSNQVFTPAFLNLLLTWNNSDPVSQFEIARNNAIYNRQGNRNPYIDNNSYVTTVWGAPLTTDSFDMLANVSVYPNPSNDHKINIISEAALDEIQLITINGQLMQEHKKPVKQNNTYTLENLPQGFYFLKLNSDNHTIVKKIVIK